MRTTGVFENFLLKGTSGPLHVRRFKLDAKPLATLTIVHGLGEHIGRYDHVFQSLGERGIEVLGYDQKGFGNTAGLKGSTSSWDSILDDLQIVIDFNTRSGVKSYLLGHSMGGLIALSYMAKRNKNIDGVIASAPAIEPAYTVNPIQVAIIKVVAYLPLLCSLPAPSGLPYKGISQDPEVVKKYEQDPLVHGYMCATLASSLLYEGDWLFNQGFKSIKTPLLMVHGDKDTLTSFKKSKSFFEKVQTHDKTFKGLVGTFHEAHNDPVKEDVIKLYGDWILHRSNKSRL